MLPNALSSYSFGMKPVTGKVEKPQTFQVQPTAQRPVAKQEPVAQPQPVSGLKFSSETDLLDYKNRLESGVSRIRDKYNIPRSDIIKIGDEYRKQLLQAGKTIDDKSTTYADLAYDALEKGLIQGAEKKKRGAIGRALQEAGNFLAGMNITNVLDQSVGKVVDPLVEKVGDPLREAVGKEAMTEAQKQDFRQNAQKESVFGRADTTAGNIGKEVGKIGTTMYVGGTIGTPQISPSIASKLGGGLLPKLIGGATEGIVDNAIYNMVSGTDIADNMSLAGGVGAAFPIAGMALRGVVNASKKFVPGVKSLASKLEVSGIINPAKLDTIKKQLIEEGVDVTDDVVLKTPESVAEWMLQRGIKGEKEDIVKELTKLSDDSKAVVDDILGSSTTLHQDSSIENTLLELKKRYKKSLSKLEMGKGDRIQQLIDAHETDGLTLSQINELKRYVDDLNPYTAGGKTKVAMQDIAGLRKEMKEFIEQQAEIEGLGGALPNGDNLIRMLNNQTMTARNLAEGIARKDSADAVRDLVSFLGGRSAGAAIGGITGATTGPFDSDTIQGKVGNILFGAFVGSVVNSTKAKTAMANTIYNTLQKYGKAETSKVYNFMKSYKPGAKPSPVIKKVLEDVKNEVKTTAIMLIKEGVLETNPIRTSVAKKTRTLGPGATQQTKKPGLGSTESIKEDVLSSKITDNATKYASDDSMNISTNTDTNLGVKQKSNNMRVERHTINGTEYTIDKIKSSGAYKSIVESLDTLGVRGYNDSDIIDMIKKTQGPNKTNTDRNNAITDIQSKYKNIKLDSPAGGNTDTVKVKEDNIISKPDGIENPIVIYRGTNKGGTKKFGFDAYTDDQDIAKTYGVDIEKKVITPKKLADFSIPDDKLLQVIKDSWKGGKYYDIERLRKLATKEKMGLGTEFYEVFDDKNVIKALSDKGYDVVKFNDFAGNKGNFAKHTTYIELDTPKAKNK